LLIAYVDSLKHLKSIINQFVFTDAKVIDVLWVICIMLFQFIHIIQLGYTGNILGNRHLNLRLIWSLVYGFIGYIITQLVILIYIAILYMVNDNVREVLFTSKGMTMPLPEVEEVLKVLVYGVGVIYIVIIAVVYIINRKLLSKGVNVD